MYVENIAEGLETSPSALVGHFSGRNVGKQVVVFGYLLQNGFTMQVMFCCATDTHQLR